MASGRRNVLSDRCMIACFIIIALIILGGLFYLLSYLITYIGASLVILCIFGYFFRYLSYVIVFAGSSSV